MINVELDAKSISRLARLMWAAREIRPRLRHDVAKSLAEKAVEFITPHLSVRTNVPHTGALEHSLAPVITNTGEGFDIGFMALFYGLYIDDGNDNLGEALASQYGLNFFPVDFRLGSQYAHPSSVIHPMGYQTPGVPNHWSDLTAKYLAENVAAPLAIDAVMTFLMEALV